MILAYRSFASRFPGKGEYRCLFTRMALALVVLGAMLTGGLTAAPRKKLSYFTEALAARQGGAGRQAVGHLPQVQLRPGLLLQLLAQSRRPCRKSTRRKRWSSPRSRSS